MKVTMFEDLGIWQDSRILCKDIFFISKNDPFCSDYKLCDQIRTSSGSIMDNIAEGFERNGNKEFIQFLSIAKGSCGECRSQSYRAFDYGYIDTETLDDLKYRTITLSKQISGFISYMKRSTLKGSKYQ